jgi:hypothetical protein
MSDIVWYLLITLVPIALLIISRNDIEGMKK